MVPSPGFPCRAAVPYAAEVTLSSALLANPVVAGDLARVEEALRESVRAEDPFLTEVVSHLINAGGKRGRPLFALSAAATATDAIAPASATAVMGAVSVELVHLGSLYHDDVMDEAATRRTVESVNARWGNLKAILAGDYLLARASEIAASIGTEVAGLLARTIAELCEGQVYELQSTFNVDRTEEAYLRSIAGKTAALFATASRIGGLVAGVDDTHVDALTTFGHGYGMAFQIVDDVLDITATDEQLGKPAGHDLVEGVYTLPVLRTLAGGGPAAASLREMLGRVPDANEVATARQLVRASGYVEDALDTAATYVESACAALNRVADNEASACLTDHARQLVDGGRAIAASAA
jgi:heptaprenyl diphosphate synthase